MYLKQYYIIVSGPEFSGPGLYVHCQNKVEEHLLFFHVMTSEVNSCPVQSPTTNKPAAFPSLPSPSHKANC